MSNTFSISVEVPEGISDGQTLAGRLALAAANVLLSEQAGVDTGRAEMITPAPGDVDGGPYSGPAAEANLRKIVGEIAPNTRIALRKISDASLSQGGIHAVELRNQMGIGSPSALAGVLTSLGFAERRTGLPKPYTQHWAKHNGIEGNEYVMEPEVAEVIVSLVGDDGRMVST